MSRRRNKHYSKELKLQVVQEDNSQMGNYRAKIFHENLKIPLQNKNR